MTDLIAKVLLWSGVTIALYLLVSKLHRRHRVWWLMPVLVVPVPLIALLLFTGQGYDDYVDGTGWMLLMLQPATVAFAIPIYERRMLIRRYWLVLLVGMVVGSSVSIATSWALATSLGLDGQIVLSLLPRSITTPFAMDVSGRIGGISELTAVFVAITGIGGVVVGDVILTRLGFMSGLARGMLYGAGAHAAGMARASQLGQTEGAIAGLVMVLIGALNVIGAALFVALTS